MSGAKSMNGHSPSGSIAAIVFQNLVEREQRARQSLEDLKGVYERTKAARGSLYESEQEDLDRITRVLEVLARGKPGTYADPLFVAVQALYESRPDLLGDGLTLAHDYGVLVFDSSGGGEEKRLRALIRSALVLGLLEDDHVPLAPVRVVTRGKNERIVPVEEDDAYAEFGPAFFSADGTAEINKDLAALVLPILSMEGDPDGSGGKPGVVSTLEFARVIRGLRERKISASRPGQLRREINAQLNKIQAVGDDAPLHELPVGAPDLTGSADSNIQVDNVQLMGAMISAAMLDELKLWDVMEIVLRDFRRGTLLVRRSEDATKIFKWWRDAPNRMNEMERRQFLAQTLGIPGGDGEVRMNREFNDLWVRFVSSVSALVRQNTVDSLLRSPYPGAIGQQRVRKAARDLCVNLSTYGYGMAYYAAVEFNKQVGTILEVLSSEDVRANYGGARDWTQVVDEVATLELGGARNSSRYTTLATCGGIITAWLATNVERITRPTGELINLRELTSGVPATSPRPTVTPTDYDLWNACELWGDETALALNTREELAEKPRLSPQVPGRPIQVPAFAREALEQAGISFGMSNGHARQH